MFLFKLTLPVLGTATIGAVGTGIYYGVDSWKNSSAKTTQASTTGTKGESVPQQTEVLPQPESPPTSPSLADSSQTEPNSEEQTRELERPTPEVEVSLHSEPLEK